MNCANHPDSPVSAYCQNCGKPLCTQCVRPVAGIVYCEQCLAARLNIGVGQPPAGTSSGGDWTQIPGSAGAAPAGAPGVGPGPATRISTSSPVVAGLLGTIPGVGAMYNGQFVKAFAHVIVFVVLIGLADHFGPAGILIAAWFFYQVFDAVQTAIARRDGRPLPDPLGLNDLGQRLGLQMPAPQPYPAAAYAPAQAAPPGPGWAAQETAPPGSPPYGVPPVQYPFQQPFQDPSHPEYAAWIERMATEKAMHDAGIPVTPGAYQSSTAGAYQPVASGIAPGAASDVPPPVFYAGRPEPVGAIVLIGVGTLFLLSTLGIFEMDWIGRGWPVLIILLGAWLLFRRVRSVPRAGGGL